MLTLSSMSSFEDICVSCATPCACGNPAQYPSMLAHHLALVPPCRSPFTIFALPVQLRQRRQRRRRNKPVLKRVASLALVAGVAIAVGRTGSSRNLSRRATSDSEPEEAVVVAKVPVVAAEMPVPVPQRRRRLEPPSIEGWQH